MKKKLISAICVISSIALLWSVPLIMRSSVKASLPTTHSEEAKATGYLLKVYRGRIGIFENDSPYPIRIIEVDVRTLPKSEIIALTSGVRVENAEELNKRIEDYSS